MNAALDHGPATQVLTVTVGGEAFGLPIASVRTVFRIGAITPVPLGPAHVLGLVNLRGAILPVLSLRMCLRAGDGGSPAGALAVSLEVAEEGLALVVDDTGEVVRLDRTDQVQLPGQVAPERARLITALYRRPQGLLPVLDLFALVSLSTAWAAPDGERQTPPAGARRSHTGAN